jgi:type IV pilus assembly protein PilB
LTDKAVIEGLQEDALSAEDLLAENGPQAQVSAQQREEDQRRADELAQAYGLECVDMSHFRIDNDIFRSIPFDLMLRYGFLPEEQRDGRLTIVMTDPTDITKVDELELLLGKPLEVKVGARSAVDEILQKSESAQRVLEDATEDFRLQLVQDDGDSEEVLSIDRISSDTSPIIKLVDSTVLNAIQRRASDIHIETRESEVIIKYRIDGVLYQAMEPRKRGFRKTVALDSGSKVERSTFEFRSCLRFTVKTA